MSAPIVSRYFKDYQIPILTSAFPDYETFLKLSNKEWLDNEYNILKKPANIIASELKLGSGIVLKFCRSYGFDIRPSCSQSMVEREIGEFINDLGFDIIQNDRKILDGKEIDILINEKKFGIEVDGIYWHSFNPLSPHRKGKEDKNRHLEKTLMAKEKGITLIHVTDYEWINNQDIVKSITINQLGCSRVIYARKTSYHEYRFDEVKKFFNDNHLQGMISGEKYSGLEDETGKIVMAMVFGKPRFGGEKTEILRLATKLNQVVVGGLSKIIKHSNYNSLSSFCDLSKFNGDGYASAGFKYLRNTEPGYFWTDGIEMISRQKCQRKNLLKWLIDYNPLLSESENMFGSGYRRFFNCGNSIWIWADTY